MSTRGTFTCKNCEHQFRGITGGSPGGEEWRCEQCDKRHIVPRVFDPDEGLFSEPFVMRSRRKQKPKPTHFCEDCKIPLRDDLRPMCPICKSRDTGEPGGFVLHMM